MFAVHPRQSFLPWILLLFFFSGCAALIYEIVWLQMLELIIGSSGVSLGVLLGAFMGGLCLGSYLLPRFTPPGIHPLRIFAFLEFAIGVCGILVLFGTPLLADFYTWLPSHGILVRAVIAAACLVPPTFLMGATLPAAARFVRATPEGVSWMGSLYAVNVAGSVAGCLLAGFFLLRLFDMTTATGAAFGLNVLVSAAALYIAAKTEAPPIEAAAPPEEEGGTLVQGWIYWVIALSGLTALGAEVVWTRLLSLLLGGTVYSFSIILAVFLAGMGIGSGAGSQIARTRFSPRAALGLCQLSLAFAIAWAAFLLSNSLPYWPVNPGMYTNDWGPWHMFQLDIVRCAWTVLPAAMLWGASFPLAIASIAAPGRDPGRMVGAVYAANTVGAIAGSLGFSLLVIPRLGTQWAQRAILIAAAASALIAFAASFLSRRRDAARQGRPCALPFSPLACAVSIVFAAALLAATVARVPWMLVAWGRYAATYMAQAAPGIGTYDTAGPARELYGWWCSYVGEGMNVSVAVTTTPSGTRFFHGAGKVQASTQHQDMRLQRMLGHLSALACRDPGEVRDVLVVACGAGITAGSFVPYPGIRRIVVCDIEPLVPKVVAPMFGRENYGIADGVDRLNPRTVNGKEVRFVYDDGRHYIRTLPEDAKFDVITSDPIDPWVKGSAALNTVEYYEMCKRHLKPGGVMSLWMPLYESDAETARSLIATFFEVFPEGMIFSNDEHLEGYDAVLLARADAGPIDLDRLASLLDRQEYLKVHESMAEAGFAARDPWSGAAEPNAAINLLATFAGRARDLKAWTRNAQINRDGNLRLQYLAGMHLNSRLGTRILQGILGNYRFPGDAVKGSPESIASLKAALQASGRIER